MGVGAGLVLLLIGFVVHLRSDLALGPWNGQAVGLALVLVGALACLVALLWRRVDDLADDQALHDQLLEK